MKVQKGIVKYRERDDIVCTYGVTDSGKNYYFIELEDAKRLSNGNIVASTELVEAIDPMFKAKHIGVIDGSGKEIIPFIHRVIRPINGDILLAELAEPVSESVKEANRVKNDSTANLVATASTIKEKMNAKMGPGGRFVINDQFSDATIYDINGNNLVNKEFYSFIGVSGGKLFLCKNTPDSEIVELPLTAEVKSEGTIDVSEVQVPQEVVEKALVKSVNETVAAAPVAPVDAAAPAVPPVEVPGGEAVLPPIEAVPAVPVVEEAKAEVPPVVEETPAPVEEVKEEVVAPSSVLPSTATSPLFNYFSSPAQNAAAPAAPQEDVPPVIPIAEENLPVAEEKSEEVSLPPVEEAKVEVPPAVVETPAPVEEVKTEEAASEKSPLEIAMAADPNQDIQLPVEEAKSEEAVPVVADTAREEVKTEEVAPVVADAAREEVKTEEAAPVVADAAREEVKTEEVALPPVEENPPLEGSLLPKPEAQATEEEIVEQETGGDLIDRSLQDTIVETPENEVDESDNEEIELDSNIEDSSLDDLFHERAEIDEEEDDNRFLHSLVHTDRIEETDEFDRDYGLSLTSDEDTIMTDVAKSMQALIKQNKELKSSLTASEEKLGKVLASRRSLADKSSMQEKKIEVLTTKLRSLDTSLSKLETRYQALEAKNLDQERIIEAQAHELEVMRPQLQGKEDLVQLLADAQVILEDEDSHSYRRKVA